jgi:membrane-bound serine protease (ClpP class)
VSSLTLVARAGELEKRPGAVRWISIDDGPADAPAGIDAALAEFVVKEVEAAKKAETSAIVVRVRSAGGEAAAAIRISKALRDTGDVPTVAYVDGRAVSAGALVAISCDKIYMNEGSVLGEAGAVTAAPDGGVAPPPAKVTSALRAEFRAAAEANGRNVALAEAMVDPEVVVLRVEVGRKTHYVRGDEFAEFARRQEWAGKRASVAGTAVEKGKLLTMTAEEAREKYRFIDGVVKGRDEFMRVLGRSASRIVESAMPRGATIGRASVKPAHKRALVPPPELGDGPVHVIPIDDGPEETQGMIDGWLAAFVARHVEQAEEAGASCIVFEVRSNGGTVQHSVQIADVIMEIDSIPTIAYVNGKAISGGALVALACQYIYMKKSSVMGDVQAVMTTPEGPKPVGEKIDTVMRAKLRSEVERRADRFAYEEQGAAIAEALTDVSVVLVRLRVDDEIVIVREKELARFVREREDEGRDVEVFKTEVVRGGRKVVEKEIVLGATKLLTMTSREAFEDFHIIDGVLENESALLELIGKTEADLVRAEASWPQEVARFIGGPMISGLLVSVGMLALLITIYAPGKSVGAFVFLFAMGLFFWSKFLGGNAGPIEVVFFLAGVVLLAIEVFVIPGFGVAGFSGIGLVLASLILSFVSGDVLPSTPSTPDLPFPWGELQLGFFISFMALAGAGIAFALLVRFMVYVPVVRGMVLEAQQVAGTGTGPAGAAQGADAHELAGLVGRRGVAQTDLRPSGKVEIDGDLRDAVTEGEFLDEGCTVRVMEASGNRILVTADDGGGATEQSDDGGEGA